jgi:type II secretory pathway pseudopilin PulG
LPTSSSAIVALIASAGPAFPRRCTMPRSSRHRGLTFLEVVISLAMVGTITAMITGGIGFMERVALANRQRLDAAEVAHRIIIQQIDDDRLWKQGPKRVELNGTVYEFELHLEVLFKDTGLGDTRRGRRTIRQTSEVTLGDRLVSKLHLITARVWAVDPPQTSRGPLATMTRVYDILDMEGDSLVGRILRMQEEDMQRQIDEAKEQRERNRREAGGGGS